MGREPIRAMCSMSDAEHTALQILKSWVLNLRVGNDPAPKAWAEIRKSIDRMPEDERDAMRAIVLDLLNEPGAIKGSHYFRQATMKATCPDLLVDAMKNVRYVLPNALIGRYSTR